MPNWTPSQTSAIDHAAGDAIVCAAAGSGKTAVVVERVLRRVLAGDDIQRMLILTFSRAAAAELRQRIGEGLRQAVHNCPMDAPDTLARLALQESRAQRAHIGTIHSFCLSVLRRGFAHAGLAPDFAVAGEPQQVQLRREVGQALVEQRLTQQDADVAWLLDAYGGREGNGLLDLLEQVRAFLCSLPDPAASIRKALEEAALSPGQWRCGALLVDFFAIKLEGARNRLAKLAWAVEGDALLPVLFENIERVEALCAAAKGGVAALSTQFAEYKLKAMPWKKSALPEEQLERVQTTYKSVTESIKKVKGHALLCPPEDVSACALPGREALAKLLTLAVAYDDAYTAEKQRLGWVDMGDMERLAYVVLQDTQQRREWANRFDAIIVDEYQDTSLLQEAILTSVSRDNLYCVGDVKQCIYRFRQAQPQLFVQRATAFGAGQGGCRYDLNRNFRCSTAVVDAVNAVFERAMGALPGNPPYGEKDALVASDLAATDGFVELYLDVSDPAQAAQGESLAPCALQREAQTAAARIRALHGQPFTDKKGVRRPRAYRDIVILLRGAKALTPVYVRELEAAGIPVYAQTGSVLDTTEVAVFLNLLRLIDNPCQDVPLLSVLSSCLVGLSPQALLDIRQQCPDALYFWEAAQAVAQGAADNDPAQQLRALYTKLDAWRLRSRALPLLDFLEYLLEDSGYRVAVGGLPAGELRRRNLDVLLMQAEQAEQLPLCALLRMLDAYQRQGKTIYAAQLAGEGQDVVRILSVHRSKGLEFPTVLLGGMGSKFNLRQARGDITLHAELGMALCPVDTKRRVRLQNPLRDALRTVDGFEARAEELRILYVAMTRAQHSLVLLGSAKAARLEQAISGQLAVAEADSQMELVLCALGDRLDGENLPPGLRFVASGDAQMQAAAPAAQSAPRPTDALLHRELPSGLLKRVVNDMDAYQVSPVDTHWGKRSVTGLAAIHREKGEFVTCADALTTQSGDSRILDALQRGTAMHAALRVLKLDRASDADALAGQVRTLVERGLLTQADANALDLPALLEFAASPLAARMAAAQTQRREWPFTLELTSGQLQALLDAQAAGTVPLPVELADTSGAPVLVQGVVDAAFLEPQGWIILDYKTGRMDAHRYAPQLAWYARAISQLSGQPVAQAWVCGLSNGSCQAVRTL